MHSRNKWNSTIGSRFQQPCSGVAAWHGMMSDALVSIQRDNPARMDSAGQSLVPSQC